jgi:hypothetical protein
MAAPSRQESYETPMTTIKKIDLASENGQEWRFRAGDAEWRPIRVPAGGWKTQGYDGAVGVYRTKLEIPAEAAGRAVRIAFEAVNFGARVFVGRDSERLDLVAEHVGGWMPFTADLTGRVAPGDQCILEVEVKGKEAFKRDGKYLVAEAAPWQPRMADGILRGIALEIAPIVFVDDIFVKTSVFDDQIRAEAVVENHSDRTVSVTLKPSLQSESGADAEYPEFAAVTATLEPGERRPVDLGCAQWGLGPESYWWPNVPYAPGYRAVLHRLNVELSVAESVMHRAEARFGFRQFEAVGNAYHLNGIHCNLRGDNQQEANFGTDAYGVFPGFGRPTDSNAGWPQAVDNLLRVNHNVLRIHQVPCTPYMLDVADELGLMIVDETPVRGSEGVEDFVAGRENMIRAARELALRDRRHPCIVVWSAANEIWNQRGLALALKAAMLAVDDTRPIIIDGVADLSPDLINMEHYVGGLGVLPEHGGTKRSDRPYGETEAVWPCDNSWRGFAWMSTATRIRRLKGNADIRNYVLNNAWSNYIPGQSDQLQDLEKKIKDIRWDVAEQGMEIMPALADTWNHPLIRLMQQSFHPYATFDLDFDEANKASDGDGRWPSVVPTLTALATVERRIAVFNDTFAEANLTVCWELRRGDPDGDLCESGRFTLRIPAGEHRVRNVALRVPSEPGLVALVLRTRNGGAVVFEERGIRFEVAKS